MERRSLGLFVTIFALFAAQNFCGRLGGSGSLGRISSETAATPVEWNDSKNLKWKIDLPGPGASSPIVVNDRVFVTCWTGYGVDQASPGKQEDLQRHLLCIDRATGKTLWQKSVKAKLPEDVFASMFAENGMRPTHQFRMARKFCLFGKSGVYAYDMDGNDYGPRTLIRSRPTQMGSASARLVQNLLIVPAVVESHSLIAFNIDDEQV
jgi:hypothetical protein